MFDNRQNIEQIDFFFIENRQADRYIEREGKWDKRQKKTEERKRERGIKERKIIHPIYSQQWRRQKVVHPALYWKTSPVNKSRKEARRDVKSIVQGSALCAGTRRGWNWSERNKDIPRTYSSIWTVFGDSSAFLSLPAANQVNVWCCIEKTDDELQSHCKDIVVDSPHAHEESSESMNFLLFYTFFGEGNEMGFICGYCSVNIMFTLLQKNPFVPFFLIIRDDVIYGR